MEIDYENKISVNITLNSELEKLIQSQLKTGKYTTVEQVVGEALRLLEVSNRREAISHQVKDLFEKTQEIPRVGEITDTEIAKEIEAYRISIVIPNKKHTIL